jgi:hypothetical protein
VGESSDSAFDRLLGGFAWAQAEESATRGLARPDLLPRGAGPGCHPVARWALGRRAGALARFLARFSNSVLSGLPLGRLSPRCQDGPLAEAAGRHRFFKAAVQSALRWSRQ